MWWYFATFTFKEQEICFICKHILSFKPCCITLCVMFTVCFTVAVFNTKCMKASGWWVACKDTGCSDRSTAVSRVKFCTRWGSCTIHSFIHSFHWHVQNVMIPCRSQELLPFLSIIYFFLLLFSTNSSSILPHFILPFVSWSTSQSCCFQIRI
jgi:hypothetical protein